MERLKNSFAVFIVLQICGNVSCIQTYYMNENCGKTIPISASEQVRINSTSHGDYDPNMICRVEIGARWAVEIMIYFNDMSIESSTDCTKDYLTIYDGPYNSVYEPRVLGTRRFCGYSAPSTVFESTADYVTLAFYSNDRVQNKGFEIIATRFHLGPCESWETRCSNGKCIHNALVCNGNNPCGDESDCISSHRTIIIGATVGGVALVVVAISVGVSIYCKRRGNVSRAGYMENGTPMATTTTSANMTTNFESPYGPPPAYDEITYGMGVVGQPQPQQPYAVTTSTSTKQQ